MYEANTFLVAGSSSPDQDVRARLPQLEQSAVQTPAEPSPANSQANVEAVADQGQRLSESVELPPKSSNGNPQEAAPSILQQLPLQLQQQLLPPPAELCLTTETLRLGHAEPVNLQTQQLTEKAVPEHALPMHTDTAAKLGLTSEALRQAHAEPMPIMIQQLTNQAVPEHAVPIHADAVKSMSAAAGHSGFMAVPSTDQLQLPSLPASARGHLPREVADGLAAGMQQISQNILALTQQLHSMQQLLHPFLQVHDYPTPPGPEAASSEPGVGLHVVTTAPPSTSPHNVRLGPHENHPSSAVHAPLALQGSSSPQVHMPMAAPASLQAPAGSDALAGVGSPYSQAAGSGCQGLQDGSLVSPTSAEPSLHERTLSNRFAVKPSGAELHRGLQPNSGLLGEALPARSVLEVFGLANEERPL